MKNILVLTDFSDRSKSAAEYAMHMALKIKANIFLCHALEIKEKLSYPLADQLILRNQTIKRLREIGMHLHQILSFNQEPLSFCPSISYINDLDMLREVAENVVHEKSIDLVVIGSNKSKGLLKFFGSHTSDIIDSINCPVLIVPENAYFKDIRNITYATDLTFDNSTVISYLAKLAKAFNAEIAVSHISPLDLPLSESEKVVEYSISEQLNEEDIKLTYKTIKGDNVPKGLLAISNSDKVDILTLVHKRYDFFEGLFHISISKQLAHSIKVPLLIMPYAYSFDVQELISSSQ
ncbi:universal stress protein [Pedobacter sp. P351]|uniref:universal stress protein n=1 Tax=Pedobacter superstes TaxID=3133441 RepID=UPI00309F517B